MSATPLAKMTSSLPHAEGSDSVSRRPTIVDLMATDDSNLGGNTVRPATICFLIWVFRHLQTSLVTIELIEVLLLRPVTLI